MRTSPMTRRRVSAGLVVATTLLAACGGGDEGGNAGAALPQVEQPADSDSDAAPVATPSAPAGPATVDLVGADLLPGSDVASNPLPEVVVDDVNTGREVNFKNLVPQNKPILLWMYAPH